MAEICEHAGVKKGSFYHFYPSKQVLALAVIDAHYVDIKENIVDQSFAEDVPPLARLARFVELVYQLQKQINTETGQVLGCPFGNLSTEMATRDEPIRIRIQQTFVKLQKRLSEVLQAAQQQGDLAPAIHVVATGQAMLAYFEGALLLAKNQNDPEVIRHLLPAMTQIRIVRS